jgi:hypothetical protein
MYPSPGGQHDRPPRQRPQPADPARTRLHVATHSAAAPAVLLAGGASACAVVPSRPAPPAPSRALLKAPLTYVAIGASDAAGIGVGNPARDGWVSVFARRLPRPRGYVLRRAAARGPCLAPERGRAGRRRGTVPASPRTSLLLLRPRVSEIA